MGDTTLWIALVTGATAISASWVTGAHTARSARYQANLAVQARRDEETRSARRRAYSVLVEHTHALGGLYGESRVAVQQQDVRARRATLQNLLVRQRETYHQHFLPALRAVSLEGPDEVATASEALRQASTQVYKLLGDISVGSRSTDDLHTTIVAFWDAVRGFILSGRRALNS